MRPVVGDGGVWTSEPELADPEEQDEKERTRALIGIGSEGFTESVALDWEVIVDSKDNWK